MTLKNQTQSALNRQFYVLEWWQEKIFGEMPRPGWGSLALCPYHAKNLSETIQQTMSKISNFMFWRSMKLKELVCTLEQSKKLIQIGVANDSLFYWVENQAGEAALMKREDPDPYDDFDSEECLGYFDYYLAYQAYTSAELGAFMPTMICNRIKTIYIKEKRLKGVGDTFISELYEKNNYYAHTIKNQILSVISDTEAKVRADVLIYLLENNHLNVGDINGNL